MRPDAAPRRSIDLNADLGEWDADTPDASASRRADEGIMEHVTSVNVACGGHRGDAASMEATVRAALARGLAIGAHPSYPDREGFGRRTVSLAPAALGKVVAGQIAALAAVVASAGARLHHVKPHGALYHRSVDDVAVAEAIVHAVASVDPGLVVVGFSGGALVEAARRHGLAAAAEVFGDRGYDDAGRLLPRGAAGAILTDPEPVAARLVRMVLDGRVRSAAGRDLPVVADTACVHGDTPGAAALARSVRAALGAAGIAVASFPRPA